jgi:folylpolyglutamate synthase/dihydropteroate synthase
VVSVPKPKDLAGVCDEVAKVADRIILTEFPTPTLTWYEDAPHIASMYSSDVQLITPTENAFTAIMNEVQPDEGIILLGTQSFVGSALNFWHVDTDVLW